MFRRSNDRKTEWNLNDSRILIPVTNVDSSETVNLFGKSGNCIIALDNSSLVFGLNKTPLDSNKTDLLLIQDSDLKLVSCNSEVKNQLGYGFSLIDQSSIHLENAEQDRRKKWTHENAVLDVRDILIYNKNEEINLGYAEESNPEVTKLKGDVLREEIVEENADENNCQVIIEFSPECYTVPPKEELCRITEDSKPQDVFKKTVPERKCNDFKEAVHKFGIKVKQKNNNELVENSLPLKKKAKMKKMLSEENEKSLLKQELLKSKKMQEKCKQPVFFRNNNHEILVSNKEGYNNDERPLKGGINKKRKIQKTTPGSPTEGNITAHKSQNESKPEFEITKFKNIFDLVEGLRKYRMISVSVWQILNSGLKEMNVDIVDEIVKNMESPGGSYSPQLKAFALILYFKQPAAFNFLAKVYKNGWPSLNVIKEWKMQLNSHQRPNFVGRNTNDIS